MKLSNLFEIKYGVNLELINCEIDNENGIPFVSRTSNNNGIIAKVKRIEGIIPNPAGSLSCAGGGSVLSTFFQDKEYYSGRDLYVLIPKNKEMSILEKLYYCMLISANNYRYNYGRQANRTLKDIEVPDVIPDWVQKYNLEELKSKLKIKKENFKILNDSIKFDITKWKEFCLEELFDIKGTKTTPKIELENLGKGIYPYITTQSINNGVDGFFNYKTEEGNVLVIDSAVMGYCSYQINDFTASDHVEKLKLKNYNLNIYLALFLTTIVNLEQFRYSYGRKFSQKRIKNTKIKLPAKDNVPDWEFMENYIKSLPYSDKI